MFAIIDKEEVSGDSGTVIKVIGVGGAGGNAVDHMIREGVMGVEFIAANTDAQALVRSVAHKKVRLGKTGLGAGAKPDAGRTAAMEEREQIAEAMTNADGRTDAPILPVQAFATGVYELVFEVGDYLRETGQAGAAPLFLDHVPIRFGISEPAAHYHVPLLLSPFGYSTYRGS